MGDENELIPEDGSDPTAELVTWVLAPEDIEVRDAAKREIDMRLLPWDVQIDTLQGPEVFRRGAFAGTKPSTVLLMGPSHEARMGLGQDGQPRLIRVPVGKAISLDERDDGPHATFRVARTQAGDESLALASDGIVAGVSIEFHQVKGGTDVEYHNGRRTRIHRQVLLTAVSTTSHPAYGAQAAVLAVRSQEGVTAVETAIPTPAAPDPADRFAAALELFAEKVSTQPNEFQTRMMDRLEAIEERSRRDIIVPGRTPEAAKPLLVDWAAWALKKLSGEATNPRELQARALEDIVTPDNPGQVPDAFVNDLRGLINRRRPFLESTREITAPESGMSIVVPVISQHSTAAVQATQKTEIESTAMKVTSESYDAITIAGGADVSIQMIKRATRSYIDLLISDLQAAYAANCDARAIATILAAGTTPGAANIDPEALLIGEAWENSITAFGEAPDTIWLSAAGVSDFINAKDDGTNRPLYFNLNANITVGGGPGGNVSALRPVYVPALNGTSVDVMIGPSAGFVWAEDGSFQLQADNPTLAGRDIAIVGILFFIPRYPAAFTTYDLGS